jgi:rhodanese-related sulfurtransferase
MTPKEADDFIKLNKESGLVTVLDVRTPGEYNEGHIPGAVFVDYYGNHFKQRLRALDRNKTYIIYCKAGRVCKHIIKKMKKEGFVEAHKITGGFAEWKSQNLPVDLTKVY